ncbi:MAG: winged helix-turn-helix transcriptional regulator [Alphaproteobacteria bacterium]|nr:winged helix-turn-helix transcriptional regulator [Alphaproteobacteria bacterium]MCB9695267.1 winged helix-turn-helix transcriptional regulator [Alphaproteobacteria bacterium]
MLPEAERCEEVAGLLAALAHPVRLRIVCGLLDGSCAVTPMVDCLGLPQALVSRHLAVLRDAGVVEARREGRTQIYGVVHPAVPPLIEALAMQPARGER